MTVLLTLACGLLIAWCAWVWASRSVDGSTRVAIVVVLAVTAAAFNVVVPVPSVEATTTITLCTSLVLGVRMGIATGVVAVVASSMAGGVGVWTVWQLLGVLVVAAVGAGARPVLGSADVFGMRARVALLVAAVVATVSWDVLTTVGSAVSMPASADGGLAERVASFLLLGAAFTLVHVSFTAAFTVLGGPSLLHALARARDRLSGGEVREHSAS